jgi:hypothetical protein
MNELLVLTIVAAVVIGLGLVLERWCGLHPGWGTLNVSCDLRRNEKTTLDMTAPVNAKKKDDNLIMSFRIREHIAQASKVTSVLVRKALSAMTVELDAGKQRLMGKS